MDELGDARDMNLGKEPTAIIQTIVAILVAIQVAVLELPAWAHTLLAVLIIAGGAILNRSQVTPANSRPPAAT